MPPKAKPRRNDPRHIIDHRLAIAHQVRDPLYGGSTPWCGETGDAQSYNKMGWAKLYQWFAQTGWFTYTEMQAEAARYAQLHGVSTQRGVTFDNALRLRFCDYLNARVKELGYLRRAETLPGYVSPGVGVRSVEVAIEATHDAARRAAK